MNKKIKVAFIYKKSYVFLSGDHFDNTSYYFFMHALKRNTNLDVTYFPVGNSFDLNKIKGKFNVILLPNNYTDGTPHELIGINNIGIPIICRTGDPHWAKKFDQFRFHEKWRIDYYFNYMPRSYFYKFYPSNFKYKEIFWCLESSIYQNLKPFKERISNRILITGNVGKTSRISQIVNNILNYKKTTYYFYKLRQKCRELPYVDYTGMRDGRYPGKTYPEYLSQYQASIAAATYYPVIKYFEIPAAGCLTFMEVTQKNDCGYLGFEDNKTAIFINEKNYREKFEEFLGDLENPKWEQIAKDGREYVLNKFNNDRAVETLHDLMYELIK